MSICVHRGNQCVPRPICVHAAEDIAGEYVWGNYDLLLLPPSFPYGGTSDNPPTSGPSLP